MNEAMVIAVLMRWVMDIKHHEAAIPNVTTVYEWESDLLSVTRSMLVHEFEVKISHSDYLADKKKKQKHNYLGTESLRTRMYRGVNYPSVPNYFWYATWGFDIKNLPDYAGWISINYDPSLNVHRVIVNRPAPRLHAVKLRDRDRVSFSRLLSYKIKNMYQSFLLSDAN